MNYKNISHTVDGGTVKKTERLATDSLDLKGPFQPR